MGIMRYIDTSDKYVVVSGDTWTYDTHPTSKESLCRLEGNESLVTWLQPYGKDVEDQIPCIQLVGGEYIALSMRMQKAIWRHVRLCKSFCNLECVSYSRMQKKLIIPVTLLEEKLKTQSRFAVCLCFLVVIYVLSLSLTA
jgi:hypothetical protein